MAARFAALCALSLAVGGAAFAPRASRAVAPRMSLGSASLLPVVDGATIADAAPVAAGSLWRANGAVVFAIRRAGWPLCREEALELLKLDLPSGVPLIGVIKEVAPTAQAANDTVLGVGEFQSKYFGGNALYLDEEKAFYNFLGNKNIFTLGGLGKALWRPRTAYREFKELGERHKAKGVDGNMVGDGLKLGGVLVFAPAAAADGGDADGGAPPVYTYLEKAGSVPPVAEIQAAVDALVAPAAAAAAA